MTDFGSLDRTVDRPFRYNLTKSFSLRAESGATRVKFNVLLPGAEKIDEGANSHRPPRIGAFRASLLAARTARDRFGFFVSPDSPASTGETFGLFVVCGVIEPRSHQRLGLLGEYCPDAELAKLYRRLMAKVSPAFTEFREF